MHIPYTTPDVEIASTLTGKTVRYFAEKSSIKPDGVRVLKVEAVDRVGIGKNGKRFVTVKALDVDDKGEAKFRNLHIAGIDLVV